MGWRVGKVVIGSELFADRHVELGSHENHTKANICNNFFCANGSCLLSPPLFCGVPTLQLKFFVLQINNIDKMQFIV